MKKMFTALLITVLLIVMMGCDFDSSLVENIDYTLNESTTTIDSEEESVSMTMGQKNALKSAKNYLKFSAFSRVGLINQLEFEGYSTEDATFAVDNCGADWKEQAVKKAKSYLDMSAFSKDGLIKQLEFEGFTSEEALYGVTENGY